MSKKSLSARKNPAPVTMPDFFSNKFDIPGDIKADLEKKGLDHRWINYKKFVENGNSHERGWSVYTAPKREGSDTLTYGTSVDGIIRRGDSVLASRPKHQSAQHKAWLRSKAARYSGASKKQMAEDLRQMAKEANIDANIVEGYEENEE